MIPSKYQQDFYTWIRTGSGHLILEAVAGSGKTTTIIEGLKLIPDSKRVLVLAFNVEIAKTLQKRVPSHCLATTLNGFGHRICMQNGRKVVDNRKIRDLAEKRLQKGSFRYSLVCQLASLAKTFGIIPASFGRGVVPDTEEVWRRLCKHFNIALPEDDLGDILESTRALLSDNIATKVIDYADQLYLPIALNMMVPTFDWVFLDEAQDISGIQRALLKRAVGASGRLVAVGDARQAIFGFRGADSEAIAKLARDFNAHRMPLSISYRCPRCVVALAQEIVPQIEAAPNAKEGWVETKGSYTAQDFCVDDMILCRNTAPLVKLAYRLIACKVPAKVLGRDIGKNLVQLINKLAGENPCSLFELQLRLQAWHKKEVALAMLDDDDERVQSVLDKTETITAILEGTSPKTVPDLVAHIGVLFTDGRRGVILSTIHKAKGLEAERVYFLDRFLIPSKYARKGWQLEQEQNLLYVALTRSKNFLYFINSTGFTSTHLYDKKASAGQLGLF